MLAALAVLAALAALLSGTIDPYLHNPGVPIFPLPRRWPVEGLKYLLLSLSLLLLLGHRRRTRLRLILAGLVSALSPLLLLMATPFTRAEVHSLSAALTLLIIVIFSAYLIVSRRDLVRSTALVNAATVALTLLCVFLAAEAIAAQLPASHAVGYTLSSRLWYRKFWSLNNQGYRDADRKIEPGRRIYVLGDSFAAGVGIRSEEERFSNLLHRRLAPEFRVYNLGQNGSDTRDEYRRLMMQPSPDLLILFYYTNDIQQACMEHGYPMPGFTPYASLPGFAYWIRRSYLLDLMYWQFPQEDLSGYESALEMCYTEPKVLDDHLADLGRFVDYSRDRGIPLLVVAFPHLVNAETSRRLSEPVIRFFQDREILLIDVYPVIAPLGIRQRIVNRNDAHPSPLLNRTLAEMTLSLLESSGVLKDGAR